MGVFLGDTLPVAIVADGMGGHSAGEIASRFAVEAVGECPVTDAEHIPACLRRALEKANERVFAKAAESPEYQGMGTTAVMACFTDDRVHIAHIGDSRAYIWQDGKLTQLTQDHSLMSEWLHTGIITPQEAAVHPYRHVITRAIGTHDRVSANLCAADFPRGARLLLCSDGLTNEVNDYILARWMKCQDLQQAAQGMMDAALAAGGHDNITLILTEREGDDA